MLASAQEVPQNPFRTELKNVLYKSMRGIKWGLNPGILCYEAASIILENEAAIAEAPNLSPEVEAFVRQELKRQGFAQADSIAMERRTLGFAAESVTQTLFVDERLVQDSLRYTNSWLPDFFWEKSLSSPLDTARGIIAHEKAHLEKNHTMKLIVSRIGIPLAVSLAIYHTIPPFVLLNRFAARHPFVAHNAMILAGLTQAGISYASIQRLRRSHEWEADEAIPNEPALLNGFAEYLEINAKVELEHESNWWERIFSTHPSCQARAARLRERLEAFKEKA